jgi:GDP-4-dehydro-6-deoxy-D-mannose reductase
VAGCDLLLTGATGFVGRHLLARARTRGLEVVPFAGDLRDRDAAASTVRHCQPAAVIHLASTRRTLRRASWQSLADDVAMTGSLVDAIRAHAPDRTVLLAAGSAAQYGMGSTRPLRESDATDPVTGYGAIKQVLENALSTAPLREGLRVICTRSFNHVGPEQGLDAPVAQWCRSIIDAERGGGGTLATGNLEIVRDFLDVRDVADAYLALVASAADGVVNVCSGMPTRMRAVADLLVDEATVPIEVVSDPGLIRAVDPPFVIGDPAHLRSMTGWTPAISLHDSLRDALEHQRAATGSGDVA